MDCTNGDGEPETYRPGNSAFVVGNNEQQYVPGEPLCFLCEQASKKGQERGSGMRQVYWCSLPTLRRYERGSQGNKPNGQKT